MGGSQTRKIDVRVVAATNENLLEAVQQGRFRADLYYRLNTFPVFIPPLRERRQDIPLLIQYFLKKYTALYQKNIPGISDYGRELLLNHPWPGNIRELENAIKRAVIMAEGNCITSDDVGLDVSADDELDALNLRVVREEAERRAVVRVIARVNGNVARAAEVLGISRPTLYDLMNRFGLKKETST